VYGAMLEKNSQTI